MAGIHRKTLRESARNLFLFASEDVNMRDEKWNRIRRKAVVYANEHTQELQDEDIAYLEDLRERLGLNMGEIDEAVGEHSNWYSNRQRRNSTHEFDLVSYEKVRTFLEIEYLRKLAEVSPRQLFNALPEGKKNKTPPIDWSIGLNRKRYNHAKIFLAGVIALREKDRVISTSEVHELVRMGIISKELYSNLHSSLSL